MNPLEAHSQVIMEHNKTLIEMVEIIRDIDHRLSALEAQFDMHLERHE